MKTKICIAAVAMLFTGITMRAQDGTTFGVRAGLNFQNITGKDAEGDKMENDLMLGWHAGVNAAIPIAPEFYFQPELLYTTKGATNHNEFMGETMTTTYKLNYLELPLHLVYKPVLGTGNLLLGFGPYFAYGIGGKVKFETDDESLSGTYDVEFENDVPENAPAAAAYFRPLDIGGNLFFGYEFAGGLYAQINTQLGLVDINPDYDESMENETSMKNTGFGVSLGYRFR